MKKLNQFFILFALAGLLMVFSPISAQANMGDPISSYTCDDSFFGFGENVELDYTIDGGKVVYTCLEQGYREMVILIMRIEADSDGQLTVEVPRTMVYSVNQDCESQDLLIVAKDEEGVNIENTFYSRIITLDFPKGESMIEFSGFFPPRLEEGVLQYCGILNGYDSQYLPPKKQVDNYIFYENVRCNEGLELIFKSTDNSPACVKPETVIKLQERGWSVIIPPLVYNNEAECFAAGGEWYHADDVHVLESFCNLPTADGGKQCTDSSQCESYCQATDEAEVGSQDTGMCYEKQFSTCMKLVIEGVVKGQLCS